MTRFQDLTALFMCKASTQAEGRAFLGSVYVTLKFIKGQRGWNRNMD